MGEKKSKVKKCAKTFVCNTFYVGGESKCVMCNIWKIEMYVSVI